MKWIEPKNVDTKIIRKFAILPITIKGEVRWLEFVTLKYEFFDNRIVKILDGFQRIYGWYPIEFIDDYSTKT